MAVVIPLGGSPVRECGEHNITKHRAWCFVCSEWCYPNIPCKGCELPHLRMMYEEHKRKGELYDALWQLAYHRGPVVLSITGTHDTVYRVELARGELRGAHGELEGVENVLKAYME